MRSRKFSRLGAILPLAIAVCALPSCRAKAQFGGAGPRRPPIRYTDTIDSAEFPLLSGSAWSSAIPFAGPGKPYTTGVVLHNAHGATAHLIKAVPVARSRNLVVLGTGAAGEDRKIGEVLGVHGYPPADRRPEDEVIYRPLSEVPVPAERPGRTRGVGIIIGVEYRTGHAAWFDGMEVTYRVGTQLYVGRFPMAFAICQREPCVAPKTGAPWGPQRP